MVVRDDGPLDDGASIDGASIDGQELVGGDVCLDFVNTAAERASGAPASDRLQAYEDLVRWAERTGAVSADEAGALAAAAAADPAGAARALERARAVRESIYRVFSAWSRGAVPAAGDVEAVSAAAAEASAAQRLRAGPAGFELEWTDRSGLDRAWWPAVTSAVALLLSDDLVRVKECATDNCNWLFLDLSRNRSRRWCSMKECGNRAKARRHYARRRTQGDSG